MPGSGESRFWKQGTFCQVGERHRPRILRPPRGCQRSVGGHWPQPIGSDVHPLTCWPPPAPALGCPLSAPGVGGSGGRACECAGRRVQAHQDWSQDLPPAQTRSGVISSDVLSWCLNAFPRGRGTPDTKDPFHKNVHVSSLGSSHAHLRISWNFRAGGTLPPQPQGSLGGGWPWESHQPPEPVSLAEGPPRAGFGRLRVSWVMQPVGQGRDARATCPSVPWGLPLLSHRSVSFYPVEQRPPGGAEGF